MVKKKNIYKLEIQDWIDVDWEIEKESEYVGRVFVRGNDVPSLILEEEKLGFEKQIVKIDSKDRSLKRTTNKQNAKVWTMYLSDGMEDQMIN